MGFSMTARVALAARELSRRQLALAGLLALLLAAGLTQGLLPALEGASSGAPAVGVAGTARAGSSGLSPAARASISATLGAEVPAYHFQTARGGFRGVNPAQHMGIDADQSGVVVRSRGLELGLSLQALGYGSSLSDAPVVRPSGAANRVTYARAGIGEWYVNGPFGLEQGFTLAQPPAHGAAGPLTLAIALSGDARASLGAGGNSVIFSAPQGRTLRYGGLSVSDASGRTLHSWMALAGGELLLRVDAGGARFPLRIDPTLEAPATTLAPSGAEGEGAGMSVALSADGNTALVGAPDGEVDGGGVWVFTRSGLVSEWVQSGEITIPVAEGESSECVEGAEEQASEGGNECGFGRSVALSADGETAVIGAPRMNVQVAAQHPEEPGETEAVVHAGAAWVYARSGSSWTGTELTSPEPAHGGRFGRSVALAGNGETALVGAPGEHAGHGRAWVFTGSGSSWAPQSGALLGAGEEGEGRFGRTVALSGNGEVALVGAPNDEHYLGAAWVFARSGSKWTEQGPKLTDDGESPEGRFGYSVALSEDGATALVGAPRVEDDRGAAWVFAQSGSSWVQPGSKLVGDGEEGEQFGYSVALAASGKSAIVSAPHWKEARGAAWLYERSTAGWGAAVRRLEGGYKETDRALFGASVAMSPDDGETVLVGGPDESKRAGVAWVFGPGPSVECVESLGSYDCELARRSEYKVTQGSTEGGTSVRIDGGHLAGATAVRFGAVEATSFEVHSRGSEEWITAVSPPATGTVDVTVETQFGVSSTGEKFDQFMYVPPGHGTGGKGGGGGGKGGGNGGGGSGGSGNGGEPPPSGPSNEGSPGPGIGTAQAVLAAGPISGGACGASVLSKKIAVQANNRALFKLLGTGAGKCSGKLRLNVKIKLAHKRFKLKTIGTAIFSIYAGKRVTVSVKLNAAGRALMKAGHGRLNASLLLVKQAPVPFVSRTASVRLARERAKPKPKPKT
jgi:hypothetical protein